ncbi:MAG: DegV family protein [Lactobacillales bacterium]|nr:DegV family protein [Lactobacillales bacterium]
MKIAVVTDSTAYLSEETRQKDNLFILPIPVIVDGKLYNEGVDINAEEYFELLKTAQNFPTTSQPSLGEVIELYQNIEELGYDTIISIHLSSGISGFVRNISSISTGIPELNIHVFDSLITSAPMGHMVKVALEMAQSGESAEAIIEKLSLIRDHTDAFMIVDDLNNLVRGGRLTNGVALIGSLLKIKPVLTFEKGDIVLYEKIRSSKKAFTRAEELITQRREEYNLPVKMFVIHSNAEEIAKELQEHLELNHPGVEVDVSTFGPVIGTHLGDKAVGLAITAL